MFQHVIGQTGKLKKNNSAYNSAPQWRITRFSATRRADTHVTTARHTSVLQHNQLLNLIESGTYSPAPRAVSMLHTKATETEASNQLSAQNSVVTYFYCFHELHRSPCDAILSPASERFRDEARFEEKHK